MALSYPRRVSRLVLVGPQTPANESVMGLVEEVRALEDPVPPEFVEEFQESTVYQPVPQEFLDTVVSRESQAPGPGMARLSGGGGVLSIDHDYVLPLREIDVPTLILWGSRIPLPARRTGAARGSDPRCHLEGLPRDRPRGSLGPTGVGRPGPGRVHARYSSRLVGSPPNRK